MLGGRLQPFAKLTIVLAVAMLASGCASRSANMATGPTVSKELAKNTAFTQNMRIAKVSGGKKTNPLWISQVSNSAFEEALLTSLEANDLSAKPSHDPRFEIYATLSELDQPLIGFSLTVKSTVNYEVIDSNTRKPWFNEEIQASYTAPAFSAFIYNERIRLANEGAIKENIRTFIEKLFLMASRTASK